MTLLKAPRPSVTKDKMFRLLIENQEKEITALKQREAKLVEALRFYANEASWEHSGFKVHLKINESDEGVRIGLKTSFGGKKAREVLKELGVEL